MPVRKMTDEEVEKFFGGGLVFFGQKKPLPSKQKAKTPGLPCEPNPCLMGLADYAGERSLDRRQPGSRGQVPLTL